LIDWQRKVLRDLYGTVRPEDGLRQYTEAFISVAKQNGKTFLVGGLPIYTLLMEDEFMPEAYGGAAKKDQAGLVFKAAALLVNANPDLRAKLKVLAATKTIVRRDGGGHYTVLSADGELNDGIRASLGIRDEVHRWRTERAYALRTVMKKGQKSRREPLDIAITTAGTEYESPLWLEEYETAKLVQSGVVQNPNLYVAIWEADLKRLAKDKEYWKSREARVAANPSHEDRGGFLKDSAIVSELAGALRNARAKSEYLRFDLNAPVKQLEEPVIDLVKWQECAGLERDLGTWAEYDAERLVSEWGLGGQDCFAGVDASWTTDLTAVVGIFPPFEGSDGKWTLLPFFWMPEEKVEELERTCRVPFSNWVAQGFLTATPGNAIDMRSVKERIRWMRDRFNLIEVPFDRTNFRTEAMNLRDDDHIETVEVAQSFLTLSYPTKWLLGAYPDHLLRHGNHPVLNWMAACMQVKYDDKDGVQPVKPKRMKSAKRIDGIQAAVTGLTRALLYAPAKPWAIEVW
jgi:phage terminase large subunit-like protein